MKALFLILTLLIVTPVQAARFYPSPEVPNVTCADGMDNDADGTVDAADSNCAAAATLTTDGGNGYKGNFKDAVVTGFTTAADATAGSGTYLKKSSNLSGFYVGEGALHANFTNATYYAWMRYRCSETQCAAWFSSSPIRGSVNNATQGMVLANQAAFTWVQVQYAGSNANFRNGLNGGGNQTFALNGNGAIFFKATDGLELDCLVLDPDAGTTPACPDGSAQPTVHYTILELGAETTPTDWNSAAFTNANVMTFQGYDNTNLTCTVKMLWDNAATDRLYISTDCNDTDDEIASVAEDSFSTSEDNVDFRWRLDQTQAFDSSMRMVVGNLQPVFADADWSGVDNARTFTPDFNTTVAKTVTASTSWQSFIAIDAGSVTADTIGLCNLVIRDKDAGTATTLKHLYGTTNNAMLNANEFANCKWSSTTVPASGGGGDVTAPTVSNTAETNLTTTSATITFDTNEAGTAFVVYGTATGDYTFTSSTSACSSSCVIALTGLSPGTTYYYRAKVTDAAGNTGQSAEDTAATAASTATRFVANAAAGSGNCSSAANACQFATVWASTVPGSIIEATAGTFTGANSMITPPSGLNGTAANPITVRCATDGACTLNGQSARRPIVLANNDYFIVEGFDAHSSSGGSVVTLGTGADNNIIRRVVGWDAPENDNEHIFSLSANTGNVLEDIAGFGKARKIVSIIGTSNLTVRRAWGVWQKSLIVGPKITFTNDYDSANIVYENVIGSWDSEMGATSVNQPIGILGTDGNTPAGECNNNHYYGSIAYLRSSDIAVTFDGLARSNNDSDCAKFQDIVTYIEPGTHTNLRPVSLLNISGATATQRFYTNATEIGGTTASTVGSQWTVANRKTYASIAAMNADTANPFLAAPGNGARMCYRYENGTLTSTKLWPWPMDSRIGAAWDVRNGAGAALAEFGSLTTPVTTTMETIFGTIPAACKS